MTCYPANTVAQYTTKLSNMIELEGDWEVGLTELSVPSNVENVVSGRCYYDIYIHDIVRRISLKAGHYRMVEELIFQLHIEQRAQTQLPGTLVNVEFSYDSKRIQLEIETQYVVGIEFSADLARLLGFNDNVRYMGDTIVAPRGINLVGDINSLFVYCDLLEPVFVGDTKAPLLRIVDKPRRVGGNAHRVMNQVLYVPLQKKCFDTVEINIMTDTGQPVAFLPGKSFVVLEFRRTVHPYFAI